MQHSKMPTLSEAKGSAFRMSKGVKKCYDKYVLNLPDEPELSMETFQNLEGRYARAAVSVSQEIDLVEVCVCDSEPDELVETNIIAEEVIV